MKRGIATVLVFACAFAVAFSVEVSLAKAPHIKPGEGIDHCEIDQDCTAISTDSQTCCPMCGHHVVTQARAAEITGRCKGVSHKRCGNATARCGAPRPANPICRGQSCVDLNGGG